MTLDDTSPLVLTVPEAAALLRIGRSAAYEACRCGDIPSVRLGRKIRVPRAALLALIDPQGVVSGGDGAPGGASQGPGATRTELEE